MYICIRWEMNPINLLNIHAQGFKELCQRCITCLRGVLPVLLFLDYPSKGLVGAESFWHPGCSWPDTYLYAYSVEHLLGDSCGEGINVGSIVSRFHLLPVKVLLFFFCLFTRILAFGSAQFMGQASLMCCRVAAEDTFPVTQPCLVTHCSIHANASDSLLRISPLKTAAAIGNGFMCFQLCVDLLYSPVWSSLVTVNIGGKRGCFPS